ncbi:MAG: protoporphyrinogen oxidase [Pirellulales bacterium]
MVQNSSAPRHLVVVGGGLAGLAAAERLTSAAPRCGKSRITLLEAGSRLGGVIATVRQDGWLIERSADSFLAARPEGMDLVHRLGLEDELVSVIPAVRRALVWSKPQRAAAGRLVPVPAGFRLLAPGKLVGVLASPLLSWSARLRVAAERFVPPRRLSPAGEIDESLESFAVRRLGRAAIDQLVQPLVSGIWTADPARLSMAAACPEFLAMEREWGSLSRGERLRLRAAGGVAEARGARYGQFVSFRNGMQTLIDGLVRRLTISGVETIFKGVASIKLSPAGWLLELNDGSTIDASGIVLAVPPRAASQLLLPVAPALAADLGGIAMAGAAIVSLGFGREQVGHPLDAAGMVVPRVSSRRLIAASFSSSKFPGRAPSGSVLIRGFIGGALDPQIAAIPDQEVIDLVLEDLREMLGIRGQPALVQIDRWHEAMPQYHVGHCQRVTRIREAEKSLPSFGLAGSAYTGVGIPQVIGSGQQAAALAERIS